VEVRGRNGKWFRTGNRRAVWVAGVDVVCKFCPGVRSGWRGMNAFIVVDVVKRRAEVGHHERVGGENGSRSRRGSVNGKEGANCGELAADFFFLDVEKVSDVFDHLLVRESHLIIGGAVWRRRGNDIGGVASAVGRRGQAR